MNKKTEFSGIVTRPFKIAARTKGSGKDLKVISKAISYNVGDKFVTKNEKQYKSLINKKRIR